MPPVPAPGRPSIFAPVYGYCDVGGAAARRSGVPGVGARAPRLTPPGASPGNAVATVASVRRTAGVRIAAVKDEEEVEVLAVAD
jgi:hypothetical protein